MRFMAILVVFVAIPVLVDAGGDAATKKELAILAGKWKVIGCTEGGQELPADKLPPVTMEIRADGKVMAKIHDGETQAVLSVDPAKQPKTLDISHGAGLFQDKKQYSIYKLEGGKLLINSTPPGGKEEDRPSAFNIGRTLIFERVKDKTP